MATAAATLKPSVPPDKDKDTDNKFDLSKVKIDELPVEMQEVVKGFQKDYTQKTQAISDKEKALNSQDDKIKRGEEWDNWYGRNKDTLTQYNEYAKGLGKDGNVHKDNKIPPTEPADDNDDDMFSDDSKKVRVELKTDINSVRTELNQQKEDTDKTMNSGMTMMVSLMKVIQDNEYDFKIDPVKVIDHARKEGIVDMDKAVNGSYYKEIRDAEIKKGVEDGIAKEKEKLNLNVLTDTMPKGRTVIRTTKSEKK